MTPRFLESTSAESKERAAVKAAREHQAKTVTVQSPHPSPPPAEQAEPTPPPPPITEQPKAAKSSSSAAPSAAAAAAEDPKPKPPQGGNSIYILDFGQFLPAAKQRRSTNGTFHLLLLLNKVQKFAPGGLKLHKNM